MHPSPQSHSQAAAIERRISHSLCEFVALHTQFPDTTVQSRDLSNNLACECRHEVERFQFREVEEHSSNAEASDWQPVHNCLQCRDHVLQREV